MIHLYFDTQMTVSFKLGLPGGVMYNGVTVTCRVSKEPVDGPVKMRPLNLYEETRAELTVHGGENKNWKMIMVI